MAAGKLNLYIEQGASWARTLTITDNGSPKNLTGHTFRGQIRRKVTDVDPQESFNFSIVSAVAGTVNMSLSATETASIDAVNGVYDVEMVSPDLSVTRILEGTVFVSPNVTR